nr:septin-12 isoform X3 [Zootoca vivipara]
MSQLSVKEHLDGILSDFEALKRSFDMEDAEEVPLGPSPPGVIHSTGNGEGKRLGPPIQPTYQAHISLSSSPSPAHSPILKSRIGSSLSFNRGTTHPPRANGTNLNRVSSFQTRLNPNGLSSSLGPESNNESFHSSSSSLECPVASKGPRSSTQQSESLGIGASHLPSPILKKFSSYGNVFHAEVGRPIRQVSKATGNHSSLPSLDLHIAEDQGPSPTLCSTPNMDPAILRSSGKHNCVSPLPKNSLLVRKESPVPPLEEASKLQTLLSSSCTREGLIVGTNRPLEVSLEKKDLQDILKEESSPEPQRRSMEEQPAREQLSRDGPSVSTGDQKLFGYVGIEAVMDQMRIKTMKTGFEFNIMVVGQSGLGKSTMVNTLFKSKVSRKPTGSGYEECIPKTLQLLSVTRVVEEKGVKMKLTVTDTPGFGDQINNQNCWDPIIEYINDQYERYLREEILINRKRKIPDTRVHACVYFVPPTGHWLRPLDLEFMRRLSKITNVVPVIAKADTLTLEERAEFKRRIQDDLKAHGIHVYPQEDLDSDPDDRLLNDKIREKIPFAVVGADKEHQVNGKKVLGRKTKWGIIEVENSAHCEFPLLRDLLIRSHLQDLKDITHSVHYEQYRAQRLNENNLLATGGKQLALNCLNGELESQL